MFELKTIKGIPDKERELMITVFKIFGREITWEILKELHKHEEGLTQDDFKKIFYPRKTFSRQLNDMKALGLVLESRADMKNPMNTEKIYYIDTNHCHNRFWDKNNDEFLVHLTRHYSNEEIDEILSRNKKSKKTLSDFAK